MNNVIDILQTIANRPGRKPSPLIGLHRLPAHPGVRISHLAIDAALNEAWVRTIGTSFFQAHSVALAALRRGEAVALTGSQRLCRASIHLLVIDQLQRESTATALFIVPDAEQARLHEQEARQLAASLRPPLTITATTGADRRSAAASRLVITTLAELHSHLLRFHDRAWRYFWQQLRVIAISDLHHYYGIAASHLSMVLLRASRLAAPDLLLLGSLAPVTGAEDALSQLTGRPWRITPAADLPWATTTLALWQGDDQRLRDATLLIEAFLDAGASVHVTATPLEVGYLRSLSTHPAYSAGASVLPAQVQILPGASVGATIVHAACVSDATLVIVMLGNGFGEPALQRLAVTDLKSWPLLQVPTWPTTTLNSFVAAQHLVCAATEQPLRHDEVQQWGLEALVDRLTSQAFLHRLPDPPPVWLPGIDSDPYIPLDLHAAGMEPLSLRDEQGRPSGTISPTRLLRWAYRGAALPPLHSGQRVIARDDERGIITLAGYDGLRSIPLRRCQVHLREEWGQRAARLPANKRAPTIGWGRVTVIETIYGYREQIARQSVREHHFDQPLTNEWHSRAIWFQLTRPLTIEGQMIGWSCAMALSLTTLYRLEDCVTAYDPATRQLYLIDAHPNGNGLADWLYEQVETILPLAYDLALDQRNDPLFEPLARADMDWLLELLSGSAEVAIPVPPVALPARPARSQRSTTDSAASRSDRTRPRDDQPPARPAPRDDQPPARPAPRDDQPPARPRTGAITLAQPDPPPDVAEADTTAPDPAAILARLRQRRSQSMPPPSNPSAGRSNRASAGSSESRFRPGDRIICMPYGAGSVRQSIMQDDREIIVVEFDDHGELTIDPTVSIVRRLPPEPAETDE